MTMDHQHYLLIIFGDVEPELRGPFASTEAVEAAAQQHRSDHGDTDGLYHVRCETKPSICAFAHGLFVED